MSGRLRDCMRACLDEGEPDDPGDGQEILRCAQVPLDLLALRLQAHTCSDSRRRKNPHPVHSVRICEIHL